MQGDNLFVWYFMHFTADFPLCFDTKLYGHDWPWLFDLSFFVWSYFPAQSECYYRRGQSKWGRNWKHGFKAELSIWDDTQGIVYCHRVSIQTWEEIHERLQVSYISRNGEFIRQWGFEVILICFFLLSWDVMHLTQLEQELLCDCYLHTLHFSPLSSVVLVLFALKCFE